MGLRELAESDLGETLEDKNGAGSPFNLIDTKGAVFPLTGTVGDIGFLLDNETGLPVQGRTITATFRISTLAAKTSDIPGAGWRVVTKDLTGKENSFFVINYEPDHTIGIGRIRLGVK